MEIITFSLYGKNFNYIICSIYRPPQSDPYIFNEMLCNRVLNAIGPLKNIILIGDFNINLFNPSNLNSVNEFLNSMFSFNLFPIITKPTRLNNNINAINQFSLIDHIWSNFKTGFDHASGIIECSLTDHFPIFYLFREKLDKIVKVSQYRVFNNNLREKFSNLVNNTSFDEVFIMNNLDFAFDFFYKKLFDLYDKVFPKRNKKSCNQTSKVPWMTAS